MKHLLIATLVISTAIFVDILSQYLDAPHITRMMVAYCIIAYNLMSRKRFGFFGTFDKVIIILVILTLVFMFVFPYIIKIIH